MSGCTEYTVELSNGRRITLSSPRPPERDPETGDLQVFGRAGVVAKIGAAASGTGGWVTCGRRPVRASAADNRYFVMSGKDGNVPRFAASKLGAELLDEAPAAKDAGGRLYAYHDDAWQPDGAEFYRREVRTRMKDHWLPKHAGEVVQWIEDGAPSLDPAPPLDRIRVENGIVRLGKPKAVLEDHSVDPLTPVHLPVWYDRSAKCPAFREFMKQALSPKVRKLTQEVMGYLLVPDNSMQKAFLAHGEGGNGKTTWVQVCEALLGEHNATAHELHTLGDNRFAAADLYGKLANICADISSRELSSSALFRAITGGDSIMGEHKFRDPFKFKPYARLIFSANRYPPIATPTNALFDRWIVLPFDKRFRGTEAEDPELLGKLTRPEELSGVLNYALEGLARLRKQGQFTESPRAERALRDFRLAADTVASFLAEEVTKPGFYVTSDVHHRYLAWCENTGHESMTRNQLYERVDQRLGKRVKVKGHEGWRVRKAGR